MKNTALNTRKGRWSRGFSLIEVLVTILILAFGLMGLAGMQLKSQTLESESYQRAQALVLLQDMVARINANRGNASTYVSATTYGTGNATACTNVTTVLQQDLCDWDKELKGQSETLGGNSVGAMVGGRGCIEQVGTNPLQIRVSVAWQGLNPGYAQPVLACGINQYGVESERRVIDSLVTVACLTC